MSNDSHGNLSDNNDVNFSENNYLRKLLNINLHVPVFLCTAIHSFNCNSCEPVYLVFNTNDRFSRR